MPRKSRYSAKKSMSVPSGYYANLTSGRKKQRVKGYIAHQKSKSYAVKSYIRRVPKGKRRK